MKYKKYHRKYPDNKWNYRAISTRIGNKEVIFFVLKDKSKRRKGLEIYSGRNYDISPSASKKSYSRAYGIKYIPKTYKPIYKHLKYKFKRTKWSKKKYINFN